MNTYVQQSENLYVAIFIPIKLYIYIYKFIESMLFFLNFFHKYYFEWILLLETDNWECNAISILKRDRMH